MPTTKSFEELFVWQKARELTKIIYDYTKRKNFSYDHGLVDQIRRASVSVMSNIAEGFERGTKEEILYFLYIAKASCGEVRAQLYVAFDQKYIDEKELNQAVQLARYVSSLIFKFINSLKVSKYKGLKFKKELTKEQKEFQELIKQYLPKDKPYLQDF